MLRQPRMIMLLKKLLRRYRKTQRALGHNIITCSYFGVRYRVDLRDIIGYEIAVRRLESIDLTRFMALLRARRPAIFIDVGANIGLYACTIAVHSLADRIVAFEPDPGNFRGLQETIRANDLAGLIEAREAAVGASQGSAMLTLSGTANRGLSAISPQGSHGVVVTSLDAELPLRDAVIALKIDVEGYEPEVLCGAKDLLLRNSGYVLLEARGEEALEAATNAMTKLGWRRIDRHGINVTFEK